MNNQPAFIIQDVTPYDIAAINQGGCASGAYMPAVTYHIALETMGDHSLDILVYIEEALGEVPAPPTDGSWGGMAVFYVSLAVELWCSANEDLADWENDEAES
jgi:hypothetical protein